MLKELEQYFNMGKWARSTSLSEAAISSKASHHNLREMEADDLAHDGPPSLAKVRPCVTLVPCRAWVGDLASWWMRDEGLRAGFCWLLACLQVGKKAMRRRCMAGDGHLWE